MAKSTPRRRGGQSVAARVGLREPISIAHYITSPAHKQQTKIKSGEVTKILLAVALLNTKTEMKALPKGPKIHQRHHHFHHFPQTASAKGKLRDLV